MKKPLSYEETHISLSAIIWIWLFSGGPMVAFGLFLAFSLLSNNLLFWDIVGIFVRALGLTLAIALPVGAIAYFRVFWTRRNPEDKRKSDERWRKLSAGREPPARFSLRFLLAYIVCFFAIIPYGILLSFLGAIHFYAGFGGYLVSIPLAYWTSRKVLLRVVWGISPSEQAKKEP